MSLFLVIAFILILPSFLLEVIGFSLIHFERLKAGRVIMGIGSFFYLVIILCCLVEFFSNDIVEYKRLSLAIGYFALLVGGLIPCLCWGSKKPESRKGRKRRGI